MSLSKKISVLLEMIKFKLTIFAMPFAFTGAFLAADGAPELMVFFWIILAMATRTRGFSGASAKARAASCSAASRAPVWRCITASSARHQAVFSGYGPADLIASFMSQSAFLESPVSQRRWEERLRVERSVWASRAS